MLPHLLTASAAQDRRDRAPPAFWSQPAGRHRQGSARRLRAMYRAPRSWCTIRWTVSAPMQKLQMVTQRRQQRTRYAAIRGNFRRCAERGQAHLHRMRIDPRSWLEQGHMTLSSANSINWGQSGAADRVLRLRVLRHAQPQAAYSHGRRHQRLRADRQLRQHPWRRTSPSRWVVPVAKLICASNRQQRADRLLPLRRHL